MAQRFTQDRPGDTTLITRRRDGYGQHYVGSAEVPRFIRPRHVAGQLPLALDTPLVLALIGLPDGDLKSRIDEAIDSFLRANTDAPSMRERSEMVLMRVAFETLLDSTHETSDLRRCFREHFQADLPSTPIWATGSFNEAQWRARWTRHVERPFVDTGLLLREKRCRTRPSWGVSTSYLATAQPFFVQQLAVPIDGEKIAGSRGTL